MSMCDLVDLLEYWKENPPAHLVLKAAYFKPKKRGSRDELAQFIGKLGGKQRS